MNASDRNLVVNKRACFVKSEINDIHFVVHPTSQHICRVSLSLLKQRRNHKKKLDDLILNHNLLRQYRERAGAKGLAVKTKVTAKRSLLFVDEGEVPSTSSGHRSNCEDESTEPALRQLFTFNRHQLRHLILYQSRNMKWKIFQLRIILNKLTTNQSYSVPTFCGKST